MNKLLVSTCLLSLVGSLHASSYNPQFSSGFANGGVIPDGNLTGWSDTRIVSGIAESSVLDLNVRLDFAGGCRFADSGCQRQDREPRSAPLPITLPESPS